MINYPVGIRSLAVSFPSIIRTSDRNLVTPTRPRRNKVVKYTASYSENSGIDIWSQEVAPYLSDPVRGNVERRVLGSEETSLTLEYQAAQDALDAAQLTPDEIDLAIATSLFPEKIICGNAITLANQLNLQCPAWNLESTCSSALIALENAVALIKAGMYRRILVVTSHIGSNSVDEEDTLALSMGDGAGAFVVESLKPNQGILSSKIINTGVTAGAYSHELITDHQGKPRLYTRTGENVSMLAETAVDFVRTCCKEAIASAGLTLDQINFFAFNTPNAWYASVCTRALDINPERTINLYPRYANIGPVMPIANLYHAVLAGKIHENDLVLIYTNGAGATAGAMVMRWGDVAMGTKPALPISVTPEQEQVYLAAKDTSIHTIDRISQKQLLAVELETRRQMIENYLIQLLSELLGIKRSQLNYQQSLAYLINSLIALELKRRIDEDLQLSVPMSRFLEDNSITKITNLLLEKLAIASLISSPESGSQETNIAEITL